MKSSKHLQIAKMVAQVVITSREMIQPSSPTPLHLRELKLSFLDQIAVPIYTPFIFFYQPDQLYDDPFLHLKRSLSDILTVFYPLAGRIQDDNASIACNDKGAEFIKARVHAQLSNVAQYPDMEELRKYLPVQPQHHPHQGEKIVLSVQVNLFDCGGIAIAVCLSHKIADGTSLTTFIKAWAATSRGEATGIVAPNFHVLAEHFPPGDLSWLNLPPSTHISSEKIVTRRFIFDNEKLASLKAEITTVPGSQVTDPTRVEAVSASIWNHFIEHNQGNKLYSTFATLHPVNIRPRMDPQLPEDQAFGNGYLISPAFTDPDQDVDGGGHELHHLAHQLRRAIRKVNRDYIREVQSDGVGYYLRQYKALGELLKQGTRLCNFSSWCRFPLYEVDYGWGKPVWVCTTPLPFKNLVILMSRADGQGIEAWINMLEDDDMHTLDTK